MLTIHNLSISYHRKREIIHNISLTLDEGITILIGENGSGKTTLLKGLLSMLPVQGEALFERQGIEELIAAGKVSYLPQRFDLYPQFRVRELLSFIARLKGINPGEIDQEISSVTRQTDIAKFADEKFKSCSEGVRRRVGIAAALIGDPELIILDEPTAGIDPKERIQFYKTIKACFIHKIVLISTHILDDIDMLANHIVMLSEGEVAYSGDYKDFRRSLDHLVYEVTAQKKDIPEIEAKYRVLSVEKINGASVYRVISDSEDILSEYHSCSSAAPTIEDLWLYYKK